MPFPGAPVRDPAAELRALAGLRLNYDPTDAGGPAWHHDYVRHLVAREPPGQPETDGPWAAACRLVRDYEFVPPTIVRGYFHRDAPLVGRDMLLVGRFGPLRFPMGVRVDAEIDEVRAGPDGGSEQVWGWSYRTLEHHLERGRLVYEVTKDVADGRIHLVLTGVSQPADIASPVIRAGFGVFGRWTQRRFYSAAGRRLTRLLAQPEQPSPVPVGSGDVVTAPTHRRRSG